MQAKSRLLSKSRTRLLSCKTLRRRVWVTRLAVSRLKESICLVAVGIALERTLNLDPDVVGLLLRQRRQVSAESRQVQPGNLLIQLLRKKIHIVLVRLGLLPILQKVKLSQDLVGEGAGHDEGRMTSGASEVQQPACSQDNDAVSIWEQETVDLRLDVLDLDAREVLQTSHVNLVVKVTDVTHDGIVLHFFHVLQSDDV